MTIRPSRPPLSQHQSAILEQVTQNSFVTIKALATTFSISAQTVRRNIIALSDNGRLQRFHDGAGPADAVKATHLDHGAKREIGKPAKLKVARKATSLIPNSATLFLNIGTTIEACARELTQQRSFTIFTTSMHATIVFEPDRHTIYMLNKRLADKNNSLIGEDTVQKLAAIHLDITLIACSAIDPTGQVMDFNLSKIAMKRTAMAASAQSMLLSTRSKFGRTALGKIADLDDFGAIITEDQKYNTEQQ